MIEVIAKPELCAAAIISMIIRNMVDRKIDQEEIATFFGVSSKSSQQEESYFQKAETDNDIGISFKEKNLNDLFEHYNIPLTEQFILYNQIQRDFFTDAIEENFKSAMIACGFSYSTLFKTNVSKDIGHAAIITKVIDSETIEIYDPGPENAGFKAVSAEDMYHAIERKKDGLWVIKRTV